MMDVLHKDGSGLQREKRNKPDERSIRRTLTDMDDKFCENGLCDEENTQGSQRPGVPVGQFASVY